MYQHTQKQKQSEEGKLPTYHWMACNKNAHKGD
jgi:hypothetical protein